MKITFETRFKTLDNECSLLLQLSQLKKEMHEPMREFVEKFNRLIERILAASRPNGENQKIFFINAIPPNVYFHLIKDTVTNLATAQRLATQLEDAFITAGKWKIDVQTFDPTSSSTLTDPFTQRSMNDIAMLKRK